MLYKLPLKNSDKQVLVSGEVYEKITSNKYFQKIDFLKHLRLHSSGYAFFQKNYPRKDGTYKNETIYLHRWIAETFIEKPDFDRKLFVTFKNGNRLDSRLENIDWSTSSMIVRQTQKITNTATGFRGVSKANQKYRAAIFKNGERVDSGNFDTPEEAARAYNEKSIEWFGYTKSLNIINGADPIQEYEENKKAKKAKRKEEQAQRRGQNN